MPDSLVPTADEAVTAPGRPAVGGAPCGPRPTRRRPATGTGTGTVAGAPLSNPRVRPAHPAAPRPPGFRQVAAISASLVGTQAVTSVLGLGYWALAARQSSVAAVGVAGAAVSLMLLLGSVGMLGLGTLLMSEIPKQASGDDRRRLVRTSLLTAGVASTLLGGVVAAGDRGGGRFGPGRDRNAVQHRRPSRSAPVFTGLTMVFDQAVLVVDRSRVQLERNTVASIVKIVALVALAAVGRVAGMDIFLAWTIGNAVSLVPALLRTKGGPLVRIGREGVARLVDLHVMRRLARSAASHHALNLMLQAPLLLLSVVVAVVLSAEANGYFSTAKSITGFVFVLPFSITIALFASARGQETELVQRLRYTIPFGIAVSIAGRHRALSRSVRSYWASSARTTPPGALTTLRILVLAGIPFVIKDHFVALRRVQNRTGNAAVVALGGAVLELVAAVVGAKVAGTAGLCAFWVGALMIEAILLSRPLLMAVRSHRPVSRDRPDMVDRVMTAEDSAMVPS